MNAIDSAYLELIQQIRAVDIDSLTPINALNILAEMKKKAQGL